MRGSGACLREMNFMGACSWFPSTTPLFYPLTTTFADDGGTHRLSELEAYLAFIEHTLENLQFIVWFQSYRERFMALPKDQQDLSPPLDPGAKFAFQQPGEARTQICHQQSLAVAQEMAQEPRSPISPTSPATTGPMSPASALTPASAHPLLNSDTDRRSSISGSLAPSHLVSTRAAPQAQPFRDECARIVATFFRPGASKELSLSHEVRDTIVRHLTWNTHPDVVSALPLVHICM